MASMTSMGRTEVPPNAVAAALTMKLCGPLFNAAMTSKAVHDPDDKAYSAWYLMRKVAERFMDQCSLEMPPDLALDYRAALETAHRVSHPHAIDLAPANKCECATAFRVISILQLLAASQAMPARKAMCGASEPLADLHGAGAV